MRNQVRHFFPEDDAIEDVAEEDGHPWPHSSDKIHKPSYVEPTSLTLLLPRGCPEACRTLRNATLYLPRARSLCLCPCPEASTACAGSLRLMCPYFFRSFRTRPQSRQVLRGVGLRTPLPVLLSLPFLVSPYTSLWSSPAASCTPGLAVFCELENAPASPVLLRATRSASKLANLPPSVSPSPSQKKTSMCLLAAVFGPSNKPQSLHHNAANNKNSTQSDEITSQRHSWWDPTSLAAERVRGPTITTGPNPVSWCCSLPTGGEF